jgi:hypothetical protein
LKNPKASAGFEPANLGTKGQHATCRPSKTLTCEVICWKLDAIGLYKIYEDHEAIKYESVSYFYKFF